MINNMILIFAVDNNWNIGFEGDILYKISEDLKRFKRLTVGNIAIMGRKTFESLPESKALPDRINVVITRDKNYSAEDIIVVNSTEELLSKLEELNPKGIMQYYCIGGGNIGRQLMPYCNRAAITKIYKSFENADTSLPNLDQDDEWAIDRESKMYEHDGIEYQYVDYIRVKGGIK